MNAAAAEAERLSGCGQVYDDESGQKASGKGGVT